MATESREAALGAGHETATGMPQLDFTTLPNQIFWLLIALGAIYFVLSRVALPRIESVLSERQGTITNDIAAAEELKLKAAENRKSLRSGAGRCPRRGEPHRGREQGRDAR